MKEYCMYLRKSRADVEAEARGEGEPLSLYQNMFLEVAKRQKLNVVKIIKEIDVVCEFLKIIIFILFSLILCSFFQNPVYAEAGFDMSEISADDLSQSFIESIEKSDKEIMGENLRNFDVSSEGNTIVCLKNKGINIYDSNLVFKYSISYNADGSSIAFWINENPAIYLDRGDLIVVFSNEGEILNVYNAANTVENGKLYRHITDADKEDEAFMYSMTFSSKAQKFYCLDYTKLIRKEKSTGTTEIIYENTDANSKALLMVIVVMLVIVFIGFIIRSIWKSHHNHICET